MQCNVDFEMMLCNIDFFCRTINLLFHFISNFCFENLQIYFFVFSSIGENYECARARTILRHPSLDTFKIISFLSTQGIILEIGSEMV